MEHAHYHHARESFKYSNRPSGFNKPGFSFFPQVSLWRTERRVAPKGTCCWFVNEKSLRKIETWIEKVSWFSVWCVVINTSVLRGLFALNIGVQTRFPMLALCERRHALTGPPYLKLRFGFFIFFVCRKEKRDTLLRVIMRNAVPFLLVWKQLYFFFTREDSHGMLSARVQSMTSKCARPQGKRWPVRVGKNGNCVSSLLLCFPPIKILTITHFWVITFKSSLYFKCLLRNHSFVLHGNLQIIIIFWVLTSKSLLFIEC